MKARYLSILSVLLASAACIGPAASQVTSFATRTGAVTPQSGDYSSVTETLTNKTISATANSLTNMPNIPYQRSNPTSTFLASCGYAVSSEGNTGTLTVQLPASPVPGCVVVLYANLSTRDIKVDPNGNYIKSDDFDRIASQVWVPNDRGHKALFLRFVPNGIGWQSFESPLPSSVLRFNLHNGGVRFDHDNANSRSRLCPNGDGGLIIERKMTYVAPTCAFLPDSFGGSSSTFYYIYALRQTEIGVQGTTAGGGGSACPDSGKLCVQFNATDIANFASGDAITLVNFVGTPAGNVYDDNNTILADSTHIEISDVAYGSASDGPGGQTPPEAAFTVLKADGVPVLDPTSEVMVETARDWETLVGALYVDANGSVVDSPCERNVTSYYNRQPRQFQCVLSTSTTIATSIYRTPAASFQGQFVTFAPPNSGGNPSVPWSLSMVGQATANSTPTGGAAALFDQSSRGATGNCATGGTVETPDHQVQSMAQSKNIYFQTSGVTTVPVEGQENYMHLCAFSSNSSTIDIQGTDVMGVPGGTALTATLMQ
jgi:hypothetical protein